MGKCPICKSENKEIILSFNCGKFDGSRLYRTVRIASCLFCGHIFNDLEDNEKEDLNEYYDKEYALINFENIGVYEKNNPNYDKLSGKNYFDLYKIIRPYLNKNSNILDVGCKTGGFISYLYNQGFRNLFGVDTIYPYVDYAKKVTSCSIEYCSQYSLPYEDNFFDFINMNQVLEHISDPLKVFSEIYRVLNDGGLLCVGLPDAERYSNFYFFDLYWFSLREHIQHFDLEHLYMLASQYGFNIEEHFNTEYNMMSDKMIMPNMYVIFKLDKKSRNDFKIKEKFLLKRNILLYVDMERKKSSDKKKNLQFAITPDAPIYLWGIGREFFYMYENLGLKQYNNLNLIDSNIFKQNNFLVDGRSIQNPSILESAPSDSLLIISAIAHSEPIKYHAGLSGYKGKILEF